MKVLLLVLFVTAVVFGKYEEYQGWKSYYLKPTTREQLQFIGSLTDAYEVDVLGHPIVGREGVVLVKPQHQAAFLKALQEHGVSYRIHTNNVKATLDLGDQRIAAKNKETKARGGRQLPFDNYHELEVIHEYLEDIAARYPDTVTLVEPSTSFQGRPIKYLKISTTNFKDESKPVMFIDGGIHAREWISPATVCFFINKLVEDVTEPDLLERFDWIIHPMVNPDGYKYTFNNATEFWSYRFWRKTRSVDLHPLSIICPGVDGNRNYDINFNTIGTEPSRCSDVYPGTRAFSEPETRVVRDIIHENLHRMALYLSVHSYGSMILYPWSDGTLPNNAFALHTVGVAMAEAIQKNQLSYFPNYVVGNTLLVLGTPASGSSDDYALSVGVPLSYTVELPGFGDDDDDETDYSVGVQHSYEDWSSEEADDGMTGFDLDPKYIEQVSRDTWEGVVVGARRAGDLYEPLP